MTNAILDIHHHGAEPNQNAINSIMAGDSLPDGEYWFSVGIHPWQTERKDLDNLFEKVEIALNDSRVLAIGEAGIDRLRGGDIAIQTEIFNRHVNLAITTCKPLIIHNVKASDIIIPIIKKASNNLKAIVHGFRGKPTEAQQLINSGAYISLGQYFNDNTVKIIPKDRLFIETDESPLQIQDIISTIADSRLTTSQKIIEQIALNTEQIKL